MTASEPVDARRPGRADVLPLGKEPCVGVGADGLDLRPQRGQRAAAQDLEHVGVAPLFGRRHVAQGCRELATHQLAVDRHPAQHVARRPAVPSPNRSAASRVVNGPRVRA